MLNCRFRRLTCNHVVISLYGLSHMMWAQTRSHFTRVIEKIIPYIRDTDYVERVYKIYRIVCSWWSQPDSQLPQGIAQTGENKWTPLDELLWGSLFSTVSQKPHLDLSMCLRTMWCLSHCYAPLELQRSSICSFQDIKSILCVSQDLSIWNFKDTPSRVESDTRTVLIQVWAGWYHWGRLHT